MRLSVTERQARLSC